MYYTQNPRNSQEPSDGAVAQTAAPDGAEIGAVMNAPAK